jgi:hypothetical protein
MSKLIVLMIALIMILGTVLTVAVRPAACAEVIAQNFDEEPTGAVAQGWAVKNSSVCSLAVSDAAYFGSSGKSAKFTDESHLPFTFVKRDFANQYGSLTFSFAVMVENPDYFDIYIHDGYYADSDLHGANIYFLSNGHMAYYNDLGFHGFRQFSVDTWYEIKMVMDIPKNTYAIYIDGSLEASGVEFRGFGETSYLNTIELGGQSYPTPVGYIDEISLVSQEQIVPSTTVVTLTGGLDYLLQEDVKIRLDATVKDSATMALVSNASVTLEIYYPDGSLWVSDVMPEKLTGIYEWESNQTIYQMNLEKGVYLVQANASIGDGPPSTDILLFHVDPPAVTPLSTFVPYIVLVLSMVAAIITGALLLRSRNRKTLRKSVVRSLNATNLTE